MENLKLSKKNSERISRTFSIMFNRASMYKMDHPFTIQSIEEVHQSITEGLNDFSPIVIAFNRDQLFVEDEPFDSRLNIKRLIAHFKKAGIHSISFEKGVQKTELDDFVNIFTDTKIHADAGSMKSALASKMVARLKINHVVYKKVTADDEVISKDKLKDISENSDSASMYNEVVNMMAESILMEEAEKSISLDALLSNPEKVSKEIIETDLSTARNDRSETNHPGGHIADQLVRFKTEIQKAAGNNDNLNLSDLANAVFDLKKQLIEGIQSQKALGITYENETQIIDEANALTDNVLIQLVREEYSSGSISVQRLAQIIQRMMPEPNELRRLIPKLCEAMLEEGMPRADIYQLIEELGKELQNDDLVSFIEKGAEDIGITSEELIREFKSDPSGAAELIYLAAEIRKGAGEENVLTELLVEYIERLGSKIVLDDSDPNGQEDGGHLKEVIARVESEIVDRLEKKGIEPDALKAVQQRLAERMEACFNKLKADWERKQQASQSNEVLGKTTIFQMLEESVAEGDDLHDILRQLRSSIHERGIDENNFQQLHSEIQRLRQLQEESEAPSENNERKILPGNILSHKNTLLLIGKEVSRSIRYETPFSVITFSVEKITPERPIPQETINGHQLYDSLMGEMIHILRDADIVGILTKKIIAVLLPMTNKRNAKIALSRLLKCLNSTEFVIEDISFSVKFAGAVTSFDYDETPDLTSFISAAENEHNDFLARLRNVQDLY
jgi:hypothetical protein